MRWLPSISRDKYLNLVGSTALAVTPRRFLNKPSSALGTPHILKIEDPSHDDDCEIADHS